MFDWTSLVPVVAFVLAYMAAAQRGIWQIWDLGIGRVGYILIWHLPILLRHLFPIVLVGQIAGVLWLDFSTPIWLWAASVGGLVGDFDYVVYPASSFWEELFRRRFARYFIVGSFIEAARLVSFHLLFGKAEMGSLTSNLYSLAVSLLVSFPVLAVFVWPDRPGSRLRQAALSVVVWLVALVKVPILEWILPSCLSGQLTLNAWLTVFPILKAGGWVSEMVFSCVNLETAAVDLVVAVGLKYVLFDRLVFARKDAAMKEKVDKKGEGHE